jgi:hypothetical protein
MPTTPTAAAHLCHLATRCLFRLDYQARLQGRFRNELGAHAGFTQKELQLLLSKHFQKVHWVTADYLRFKYGAKIPAPILRLITARWVGEFTAPAIYALCWKEGGG